jgi:hypothetical protein
MTYGDLLSHTTATRAGPQISVGFHRVFIIPSSLQIDSCSFSETMIMMDSHKLYWLVVSTPLKNMKVSWDYHYQYMDK